MGEKLQFTELDQYLFGQGTHYDIYKKLGAHPTMRGRKKGVYFAVWAPNARSVSVVGDFNEWDIQKNPMQKTGPIGVYETLYLRQRLVTFINFILSVITVRKFTKPIHMAMKRSFVREQHPELQIFPVINGKILPG